MSAPSRPLTRPLLIRLTPQMVVLFLAAAVAAAWTIREADGMWEAPGTMGYSILGFVVMWSLMMAAMMLPSVAPFASMYARTVTSNRMPRLVMFAAGYLLVWMLMGLPAFAAARIADEIAGQTAGTIMAVAIFAAAGLYQLTPLKDRCLSHCRSPLSHLLHAAGRKGPMRDLSTGFEHGFYCAACCWGLMALLVAFGIMNVPAMIVLAAAVAVEKLWDRGKVVPRAIGFASLAAAALVIWVPSIAPGLTNEPMDMSAMAMDSMSMEGDGDAMSMDDGDGSMSGDGSASMDGDESMPAK